MKRDEPVGALVERSEIPPWLWPVTDDPMVVNESVLRRGGDRARWATTFRAKRAAAVLVLFGGAFEAENDHPGGLPADANVLLTVRASTMRTHSGQIAFPGGSRDPGDDYPVGTAMREAREETGLHSDGVRVLASLPSFPVPSGFEVTPVLGHESTPSEVGVVDEAETSRVVRVNLRELLDPAHRLQVSRSVMGATAYKGPAFLYDGMLIWGFTGGLLAAISQSAGWDLPWNTDDVRPLEQAIAQSDTHQVTGFPEIDDVGAGAGE